MEYFAKRDNWSTTTDLRQELFEVPNHKRFAGRECLKAYGLSLVLEKAPAEVTSIGTAEDLLYGQ